MKKVSQSHVLLAVALLCGANAQAAIVRAEIVDELKVEAVASMSEEPSQAPYYMDALKIPDAWKVTKGNYLVKVGILSTGVNYRLAQIVTSIFRNPGESGNGMEIDKLDNDANGYIDDVYGANTYAGTGDPIDTYGLGTHSASNLVSPKYGLAPEVEIIPVNAINESGASDTAKIVASINYLVSRGASIINIGLGGGYYQALCDAIIQNPQVLFVASAGNEGNNIDDWGRFFPAHCMAENLVVAAGLNQESALATWSNYGPNYVHVAAPAVQIPGVDHLGGETQFSGTAMAATLASGVAALVKSANREFTPLQIKQALILTSTPQPSLAGKVMSNGVLNAAAAVSFKAP